MNAQKLPGRNTLKRYLTPGVWEDINGGLHFSLPDICKALGLAPTEENLKLARQVIREQLSGLRIVDRETWDD